MVHCAGCERPISDRFLLNVLDRAWHAKCVQCFDCKSNLTEKCFYREGKLYCRLDFFRRYGTKCAGCSHGISPNDLVRRARNKVFHLKCFTCMVCRKQLSTGEELYILDENKFICKEDYINSKFAGSDGEDDCDLDSGIDTQGNISDKDFCLEGDNSREGKDNILNNLTNNNTNYLNNNNNNNNINQSTNPLLSPSIHSSVDIKEEPPLSPASCGPIGSPASVASNMSDLGTGTRNSGQDGLDLNANPPSNDSNGSASPTGSINGDKGGKDCGGGTVGAKRRGPRTTIKAKQLEVLKAAFNATPKPTRHIREQLAQETGLNMRVIQVWFQNRRSKERRMKQLSALGARRHFFRNPRRMRGLRPGEDMADSPDMMGGPQFGYLGDGGGDFYPGYQGGYGEFFGMGPGPDGPGNMNFLPPSSQGMPLQGPDGSFMHPDMMPPSSTPEPLPPLHPDGPFAPMRSMNGPPFSQALAAQSLGHHNEMEAW